LKLFRLQIPIFLRGVEARAAFDGIEDVVAHDHSIGELGVKLLKERTNGASLGFGTGVRGTTFDVQTAFIADADRMAVTILTMCSDHIKGTARLDGSVTTNHKVIAATIKAPLT
jgi:hypothetical protein